MKVSRIGIERWLQQWLLVALLVAMAVIEAVSGFGVDLFPEAKPFLPAARISLIFFAIAYLVGTIPRKQTRLQDTMNDVVDSYHGARMAIYQELAEFYADLQHDASNSEWTFLHATQVRKHAPEEFSDAKKYHEELEKRCSGNSGFVARRIIAMDTDEEWAQEQRELHKSDALFELKILDWQLNTPMINFAVVGKNDVAEKVYCAVSKGSFPGAQTLGFRIDNQRIAQAFYKYHDLLWSEGEDPE